MGLVIVIEPHGTLVPSLKQIVKSDQESDHIR